MNIFVIARGYPSKKDPQWGCFEKDQAEAIANLGHKVTILSVDTRFRSYWRSIGIQRIKEGKIVAYNLFLFPYVFISFLPYSIRDRITSWLLELVYKRAVKLEGVPDVLYSHYLTKTQKAIHLRKKYNIPLVAIEHWSELAKEQIHPDVIQMATKTYRSVDQLITVSHSLKENIKKNIKTNEILVVHNLVGKEFYYTDKSTNSDFTFISTGSLIHRKGFDLLIDALNQIKEHLPSNWKAIIIGGGPLREVLQNQINNSNLQEHIYLIGQKNKQEILSLIQNSDIFILPSRGENFSVAVLEALACGLPIIASICGGIRECINSSNGLLFPVDDTESLANAIKHMSQHIQEYNREAIADDCQARFAPEVIAKQLTTIFEETIKTHKEQQ